MVGIIKVCHFCEMGKSRGRKSGECLRKRTDEVDEVKGVFWKETFGQLSVVVAVDKELNIFC